MPGHDTKGDGPTSPLLLKEGDRDPDLNKKVETLICATKQFAVYLDEDAYVEWRTTDDFPDEEVQGFGEVLNRVSLLEGRSDTLLAPPHLLALRRMLGEGVARLLDDMNSKAATAILDDAERYLQARSTERARTWYVSAAAVTAAVFLLAAALVWLLREWLGYAEHPGPIELILTALLGSLGALISVLRRSGVLPMDAAAGRRAHFFEGAARIVLGTAGAFLVGLAVKANLFLGAIQTAADGGSRLALLAAVCVIAGASEQMVPDLIQRVEGSAGDGGGALKGGGGSPQSGGGSPETPDGGPKSGGGKESAGGGPESGGAGDDEGESKSTTPAERQ